MRKLHEITSWFDQKVEALEMPLFPKENCIGMDWRAQAPAKD